MSYDDHGSGAAGVILSFLVGALTGAAAAILMAPRSGRETREMLGERWREASERGRQLTDDVVQKGRQVTDDVVQKGRQAIDDASTYVDRQREALEKRRDRLAAAVEAGKQAYREEKEKT